MIGAPFDIASNQLEFLKAIGLYLSILKVYFNMSLQQYNSNQTTFKSKTGSGQFL